MPASSTTSSAPNFEAIFHATSIDLLIPSWSGIPPSGDAAEWWKGVQAAPLRQVSFLDEKLFYAAALHIPDDVFASAAKSASPSEPPSELLRFLSRLQLTMTTTLLPPMTSRPPSLTVTATPNPDNLFVPKTPHMPQTPDISGAPATPNPFPRMDEAEDQYARVEGVVVWEGPVQESEAKDGKGGAGAAIGSVNGLGDVREKLAEGKGNGGRVIVRGEGAWEVIYKGQVPVAYVRTQIQNPVLGLTASVTLRDAPVKSKKAGHNAETSSIYSATDTVRTDGTEEADGVLDEDEDEDLAGMEEIDLLGGLGDERMPTSRLASSIRHDLSLPSVPPSSAPATAITPSSGLVPTTASTAPPSTAGPSRERAAPSLNLVHSNHALRKSYRRILGLSSGLRIRMRTLFLPQLLPPRSADSSAHEEDEGERRVALCVEVENPHEGPVLPFEVENITVDVGGKGGKVSAELLCQPETYRGQEVFPLVLNPVEQYSLLYGVSIATTSEDRNGGQTDLDENMARAMGRGDEQRPVAITVLGRPYETTGGEKLYPTAKFSSRWNCTLDLAPFYAASSAALETRQVLPPVPRAGAIKTQPAPNAIVGDKRFSIASLAQNALNRPGSQRMPIGHGPPPGQRPGQLQGSRVNSLRGPVSQAQGHGLLVSVKILPQEGVDGAGSSVHVLESFSLEVFVQNRTDEVRRFRVGVPPREEYRGVREVYEKRRRRRDEDAQWGMDDPVLRQMLAANLASAPALVPLEDDVRCGPLLPGASMSARLRFLALRQGVHTLERLRITGANDEFDFVLSPVLDVVVRSGAEVQ